MELVSTANLHPALPRRESVVASRRVDWMVISPAGTVTKTFGDEDLAVGWLDERRHELPGSKVVMATTVARHETVYEA